MYVAKLVAINATGDQRLSWCLHWSKVLVQHQNYVAIIVCRYNYFKNVLGFL